MRSGKMYSLHAVRKMEDRRSRWQWESAVCWLKLHFGVGAGGTKGVVGGGEQFDGVRHTQTCHYQTSSLTGLNRRITVQVGGRKGDGSEQHIYN